MLTTVTKTIEVEEYEPTEKEVQEVVKIIEEAKPCQMYWDYRDELSNEVVKKYWEERRDDETPLCWLELELQEDCWETMDDLQRQYAKELLEDEGYTEKEIAFLIDEHDVHHNADIDMDIDHFDDNVHMRFELYSNYDCQNSHHFVGGTYTFGETYFGDVCRVLQLNPRHFKSAALRSSRYIGVEIEKDAEYREAFANTEPLVKYKELSDELVNNCGPALLTILVDVPFSRINDTKFVLPKGSVVGAVGNDVNIW